MMRGESNPESEGDEPSDVDEKIDFNSVATDLNNQFDNEEESNLDPTIDKVTSHRYLSGVLELKVHFSNGITSWLSFGQGQGCEP